MIVNMLAERLRRAFRWVCTGLCATGCGASSSADGTEYGGQTGSLHPPTCEEQAALPFVVPEGQTALVEAWHDVARPMLKDANGNTLVARTETGDVTRVLTDEPLTAGDYTLVYECGDAGTLIEREINVTEAAPLPTEFGTLAWLAPPDEVACNELEFITFEWRPPSEFLPYLDSTQLTFSIHEHRFRPIPLTEPLVSDVAGNVAVRIPNCTHFPRGTCGDDTGVYQLEAHIAGATETWSSMSVHIANVCVWPASAEPKSAGCTLVTSRASATSHGGWFLAATLLLVRRYATRRKSRTPTADRNATPETPPVAGRRCDHSARQR